MNLEVPIQDSNKNKTQITNPHFKHRKKILFMILAILVLVFLIVEISKRIAVVNKNGQVRVILSNFPSKEEENGWIEIKPGYYYSSKLKINFYIPNGVSGEETLGVISLKKDKTSGEIVIEKKPKKYKSLDDGVGDIQKEKINLTISAEKTNLHNNNNYPGIFYYIDNKETFLYQYLTYVDNYIYSFYATDITLSKELDQIFQEFQYSDISVFRDFQNISTTQIKGKLVYIKNGNVYLKDLKINKETAITSEMNYWKAEFSPNGEYLMINDNQRRSWLFNIKTGEKERISEKPLFLYKWSPDNIKLAYSTQKLNIDNIYNPDENNLLIYEVNTHNTINVLPPYPGGATGGIKFTWSPDSKLLAYGLINKVGIINSKYENIVIDEFMGVATGSEWAYVPDLQWLSDNKTVVFSIPTDQDYYSGYQDIFKSKYPQKASLIKKLSSDVDFVISPYTDKALITERKLIREYPNDYKGILYYGDIFSGKWKFIMEDPLNELKAYWISTNKNYAIVQEASYTGGTNPQSYIFNEENKTIRQLPMPLSVETDINIQPRFGTYIANNEIFNTKTRNYICSAYFITDNYTKRQKISASSLQECSKTYVSAHFE